MADPAQGPQAEADQPGGSGRQDGGEDRQRRKDDKAEAGDLGGQGVGVAGHQHGKLSARGRRYALLKTAQAVAGRPVEHDDPDGTVRRRQAAERQPVAEQRGGRGQDLAAGGIADLPVPARLRQGEARLAGQCDIGGVDAGLGDGGADQGLQQDIEPGIEIAFRRLAEQGDEDQAGDDKRNGAADAGNGGETYGKRASPHVRRNRCDSRDRGRSRSDRCRVSCAGDRQRLRWCWNRGRNPARRGVRSARCAKPPCRHGA